MRASSVTNCGPPPPPGCGPHGPDGPIPNRGEPAAKRTGLLERTCVTRAAALRLGAAAGCSVWASRLSKQTGSSSATLYTGTMMLTLGGHSEAESSGGSEPHFSVSEVSVKADSGIGVSGAESLRRSGDAGRAGCAAGFMGWFKSGRRAPDAVWVTAKKKGIAQLFIWSAVLEYLCANKQYRTPNRYIRFQNKDKSDYTFINNMYAAMAAKDSNYFGSNRVFRPFFRSKRAIRRSSPRKSPLNFANSRNVRIFAIPKPINPPCSAKRTGRMVSRVYKV